MYMAMHIWMCMGTPLHNGRFLPFFFYPYSAACHLQQHKERDFTRKSWSNLTLPLAPTLSLAPRKRSSSPGKKKSKATSPSPGR